MTAPFFAMAPKIGVFAFKQALDALASVVAIIASYIAEIIANNGLGLSLGCSRIRHALFAGACQFGLDKGLKNIINLRLAASSHGLLNKL